MPHRRWMPSTLTAASRELRGLAWKAFYRQNTELILHTEGKALNFLKTFDQVLFPAYLTRINIVYSYDMSDYMPTNSELASIMTADSILNRKPELLLVRSELYFCHYAAVYLGDSNDELFIKFFHDHLKGKPSRATH